MVEIPAKLNLTNFQKVYFHDLYKVEDHHRLVGTEFECYSSLINLLTS